MSNYPDGWSRDDEILAGIEEEHPGFESYFESLLNEMSEEEEAAIEDLDRFREQALEEMRYEDAVARGEAALEREEAYNADWDGPW